MNLHPKEGIMFVPAPSSILSAYKTQQQGYSSEETDEQQKVEQGPEVDFANSLQQIQDNRVTVATFDGQKLSVESLLSIEASMAESSALITLSLVDCNLDDTAAEIIARIVGSHPRLSKLNLDDNYFSDTAVELLCAAIEKNKKIKVLSIQGNSLTSNSLVPIAKVINLGVLQCLYLDRNNFSGGFAGFFSTIRVNKNLKDLSLDECRIDAAGAKDLMLCLAFKCWLKYLSLVENALDDEVVATTIGRLFSLNYLYLDNCNIGDQTAIKLGDLLKNPKCSLQYVSLETNKITSVGINDGNHGGLAQGLLANDTLNDLSLARNQIGDQGAAFLMPVFEQTNILCTIGLEENGITGKGAQYIARGLQSNTSLSECALDNNFIKDTGARALGLMLGLNIGLDSLSLRATGITEQGASYLKAGLAKSDNPCDLELGGNDLLEETIEEIEALIEAKRNGETDDDDEQYSNKSSPAALKHNRA
jgi:Ran GTPase-activating protein (RanGAP) involved in mRNA processing and transport